MQCFGSMHVSDAHDLSEKINIEIFRDIPSV